MHIGPFHIIIDRNFKRQFRFPKSKNRRIRKKWTKRQENWKPRTDALQYGNSLIMSPAMAEALRRQFAA